MKRLVNLHPTPTGRWLLAFLPFLLLAIAYLIASDLRLAANPNDKLLPSASALADAVHRLAFQEDRRSGLILLWNDTAASLVRMGWGVAISAATGLLLGIGTGLIPLVRAPLSSFISVLSLIPPMAILPILFIVFGLGELSKVMLIVLGTAPFIARDIQQRVQEIPLEQIIKAQTLGAGTWQLMVRVVLPQMWPRLIDAVRLSLGAAWLFLISAEAIAAEDGLGYRIFLVRRYLAMDVILPYVAWITVLAFALDLVLRQASRRLFPWYHRGGLA
jgi:NitT/TauT family transport system permease protein